jgi:hypothetical protein
MRRLSLSGYAYPSIGREEGGGGRLTKKGLQKCLAQLSTACSFSASTAKISSAKMSSDKEGKHSTKVFSPDETFYCIADLSNAPETTRPSKRCGSPSMVEGVAPNTKIDHAKTTSGSGQPHFNLTNDGSWTLGNSRHLRDLPECLQSTPPPAGLHVSTLTHREHPRERTTGEKQPGLGPRTQRTQRTQGA